MRKDDDLPCPARRQCEAALGRAHVSDLVEQFSQPANLNSQSCSMRFVCDPRAERPRQQYIPRHIVWPRLAKRPDEREENGTAGERHDCSAVSHEMTTRIDN